jgi:hypothetical protein
MSQSVQVVFTRSWLPGSLLIRAVTWSRWSHCALVDGEEVIEAAMFGGVRRRPLAELLAANSAHRIEHLPVQDAAATIAAARSQLGKGYDWLGALGLALRGNWQNRQAWFCSELIAWAADHAGSPWFRRNRIRRVTPEHLWMLAPFERTV